MQASSKLVRILNTLEKSDWKGLEKLIQSPWFFNRTDQVRLLGLLNAYRKTWPTCDKMDQQALRRVVFDQGGTEGQLAKLNSKLVKTIEQYLILQDQQFTKEEQLLTLARIWRERGLNKLAGQYLRKATLEYDQRNDREQEYYFQGRLLAKEEGQWSAAQSPAKLAANLQREERYLDEWYLLTKLEQAVWQRAQRIQAQTQEEAPRLPMEQLLPFIDDLDEERYPVHALYREAWFFLRDYPKAKYSAFISLQQSLDRFGNLIESGKRKALQTLLRIFATARYNQGEQAYLQLALNLYKKDLQAGDLYFDGKIHSQTLLNLVTLGLRHGSMEWVKGILQEHQGRIWDEANTEQALRFSQALVRFYIKETSAAADLLDDHYDNLYYRLAARRLEIMIYYEENSVLLEPKLEAFKVYIFRLSQRQIPAKPKALNNNFIDLLRQIIHPSTLANEKRIARLLSKAADTSHLAEREWLCAKLEQLI